MLQPWHTKFLFAKHCFGFDVTLVPFSRASFLGEFNADKIQSHKVRSLTILNVLAVANAEPFLARR